ncbi:NAD(P)H-dependent oxidoreductase [Mogibacterium neglectum]|uniref:NAD(P)H-dependent oxidoreductase n=1 Tax=Mogibacterium neglectum TaxID=114528 RepID=UPI00272C62CC|nr:NAD(P)H-dependent oxidoreductase [Mogibacterium neglectum]WLD76962.1 NAD(P)H-dependent oxidoreductase [Mogibacterium neglectum]
MNLLIHDLSKIEVDKFIGENDDIKIISNNSSIRSCMGCFGCWIKTPGKCVINDDYQNMGALLGAAENVIVISHCFCGGYSPFIKNVMDRSIPYLLPFFKIKQNETHHKQRYRNKFNLIVSFYGKEISYKEKEIAIRLIEANAINFDVAASKISFYDCEEEALRKGLSYGTHNC